MSSHGGRRAADKGPPAANWTELNAFTVPAAHSRMTETENHDRISADTQLWIEGWNHVGDLRMGAALDALNEGEGRSCYLSPRLTLCCH
jgi:hypothetical protein